MLRGSWHPLARALGPDGFVRNDVALGDIAGPDGDIAGFDQNASSASFVALTGPNMGGKSTLLRQVALAVVMAHAGCRAPASDLRIPVDAVACRVEAPGTASAAGTSTFLAEMADASAALRRATRRSLLVFDELGRGTSTSDGYAIAFAVARAVARVGARCLFATHSHALAADVRASGGAGERARPSGTWAPSSTGRSGRMHRTDPSRACGSRIDSNRGPRRSDRARAHAATLAGFPEGVPRRGGGGVRRGGPSRNVKTPKTTPKTTPTLPPTLPPTLRGVMREDALRCFEALAADPVVEGVPGAAGDDAWAATFFALWTRCARLSPSLGPD